MRTTTVARARASVAPQSSRRRDVRRAARIGGNNAAFIASRESPAGQEELRSRQNGSRPEFPAARPAVKAVEKGLAATKDKEATLLIDCPDAKGVVAACASMLYGQGCNILDLDQHSQPDAGLFFQRIHFDYSDCYLGNTEAAVMGIEAAVKSVADRFDMKWTLSYSNKPKRMAVLVSKFDHCLYDILLRKNAHELKCEIPLIISNHDTLRHIADQFGIPFFHLPMKKGPNATEEEKMAFKLEQEAAIESLLTKYDIDVIVLARYMQVLSDDFCKRHETHTINIHHSFLPAFEGGYPYHRAYTRGVKVIGATAHYITADLDAGPIIDQDVIRISHRDQVEDMIQKGKNLERSVLSRALSWHLEDRVLIHNNKTVVFGY